MGFSFLWFFLLLDSSRWLLVVYLCFVPFFWLELYLIMVVYVDLVGRCWDSRYILAPSVVIDYVSLYLVSLYLFDSNFSISTAEISCRTYLCWLYFRRRG